MIKFVQDIFTTLKIGHSKVRVTKRVNLGKTYTQFNLLTFQSYILDGREIQITDHNIFDSENVTLYKKMSVFEAIHERIPIFSDETK
jgi:hypothetical protein